MKEIRTLNWATDWPVVLKANTVSGNVGKGRVQGGMKCNMAVADGNSTSPLCEMLFQLKPPRICLFLCLSLSPASFNLLITCERSKQSAPQNKLSAVFLRIKNVLFRAICLWVFFFFGMCDGDEDTETGTLAATASLTATRGHVRRSCSTNPVSSQIPRLTLVLSDSAGVAQASE